MPPLFGFRIRQKYLHGFGGQRTIGCWCPGDSYESTVLHGAAYFALGSPRVSPASRRSPLDGQRT
eukprot:11167409-Lingulodinium_polyedra.AAC.1